MNNFLSVLPFLIFNLTAQAQIISIDVGHNSNLPGSTSSYGKTEFSYNQKMAGVLASTLEKNNFSVNVIGADGLMLDLEKRAKMAFQSSLLVSIHHDSLQEQDLKKWTFNGQKYWFNDKVSGFGIFVSSLNPKFQESYLCAQTIASELELAGFRPNHYHNKDIKGERKQLLHAKLPIYQYDDLIVLKSSQVPALLIEAGVLTNRKESLWIAQPKIQEAFSQAVSQGIRKCFKS